MTTNELRARLTDNTTIGELKEIRRALMRLPPADVFHLLFPIATNLGGGADYQAVALLVELEPPCPLTCEEALRLLASGSWQPSDVFLPFYLVGQFGKIRVLEAVRTVSGELKGDPANYVRTVGYWLLTLRVTEMAEEYAGQWRERWDADADHIWHHKPPPPANDDAGQ
jgi:hypothetical protein